MPEQPEIDSFEESSREDAKAASPEVSSEWDELLSKYVSVWMWSILFGTTTGVLYSFLSFRLDHWGGLAVMLAFPALLSIIFAVASWLNLYRGLSEFLIPRFILGVPAEHSDRERFAYTLRRAFFMFIWAASFRALASVLELALSSISQGG